MLIRSIILVLCCVISVTAQYRQPDAAAIQLKLKKLNVLTAVLYVAAHPDDENTRAITFMANDKLAAAAYLSMTRGDGGQNLIGAEIRDQLGLIRTQELLAARRLDGGQQFFTRANDFGFSKNAAETFSIWGKEQILSDVVRIMRQFQPDVILTRFPPDARAGHGHHTASAVLAQEAFDLTNNPTYHPEQVKEFGLWQSKRLYLNASRFFDQTISESTPGVVVVNMGTYNTLLGKSYSEIAAESRSQHKSQGFGSAGRRGDAPEFFLFAKGEKADKDLFEGINTTWTRVEGGNRIQPLVEKAIREFNPEHPARTIPLLLQIRSQILSLSPSVWKERKLKETNQLIQDCAGLYLEVVADQPWLAPGEGVTCSFELVNRSEAAVKWLRVSCPALSIDSAVNTTLNNNQLFAVKTKKKLSVDQSFSDPYWLREDHTDGVFLIPNDSFIGKPENDPAVPLTFSMDVDGTPLDFSVPLIYKWTDPEKGELMRPFEVVPPIFLNLSQKVFVFPDKTPRQVDLLIKSASGSALDAQVSLVLPEGWTSAPAAIPVHLTKRGEEMRASFLVTPGNTNGSFLMRAEALINGKRHRHALQTISYDHIPFQTLLPEAEARIVRSDIQKSGQLVGYVQGAGDEIPDALRNMGYEVWVMKDEEVTPANLRRLDAVVLGIRALNTNERIRHFMPDLLEYVKAGGTLITQYNTNGPLKADKFAPYPMTLSRDRVTEESSEVRILKPNHPALNYPNKIQAEDFTGWVQERGLYFPDKYDPAYEALLSMNDAGEPARDGSLLVAKYGNGYYVYTGLSFFRELPEGVVGAYKLFANLTSLGKQSKPQNQKVKPKK